MFNPSQYLGGHTAFGDDSQSQSALYDSSPHVTARAGTNITLACPGVTPTSYIYLVEWKCVGCQCRSCPNPNGEGSRLLRFNDKLTRWDEEDAVSRRTLDFDLFGLKFEPVKAADSGTYLCLLNNRRVPDTPIILTVQGRDKITFHMSKEMTFLVPTSRALFQPRFRRSRFYIKVS